MTFGAALSRLMEMSDVLTEIEKLATVVEAHEQTFGQRSKERIALLRLRLTLLGSIHAFQQDTWKIVDTL